MTDATVTAVSSRINRTKAIDPYTRIPDRFYQGQLGTSAASLFSVTAVSVTTNTGADNKVHIKQIRVCNTDSSSRTFTLYIVPSGGSSGVATMIHNGVTIAAGEDFIYNNLEDVLNAGDAVWGKADSASKVTVTITGDRLYAG